MTLHVTQADVDAANLLVGQTPKVVARLVMRRLEDEYNLPRGAILSRVRTAPVTKARYDAICEVYSHFNMCGRRLSVGKIAYLFDLNPTTVWYALEKRGLKE